MVQGKAMKNQHPTKATTVRMPHELWAWIEAQAVKNRRSINSEIVIMLESSHTAERIKEEQEANLKIKD